MNFNLDEGDRQNAWKHLQKQLEDYYSNPKTVKAAPELDPTKVRDSIKKFSFNEPVPVFNALDHVIENLKKYTVHTPHTGYYGLYNPRPAFPGILADTITATFNPQLAAWSHAPFANEVESHLIHEFGVKFGLPEDSIDGVFTSGGAEANLTALLTAINHKYPHYGELGLQGVKKQPILYCSTESHHSIAKAAKNIRLGFRNVRSIPTNSNFEMRLDQLEETIQSDLSTGFDPFLVIGTAGTTGTGVIDPLAKISAIARRFGIWFHVDAAYGGAVALSNQYQHLLKGAEQADSITFDAHKWLSNPMSTSLYITRHKEILAKTFGMTTEYMPKEGAGMDIVDPYTHSIQWSRRFIGLRLYLSLLIFGWRGYEELVDQQIAIGKRLKELLTDTDWIIYNNSDLPVLCFGKKSFESDENHALKICNKVLTSGKAWISVYKVGEVNGLRACITNYDTTEEDLLDLMKLLND